MEEQKYNKYKERYKEVLNDYEKLENQCRSLFDRNSHLVKEIRELEYTNDKYMEKLLTNAEREKEIDNLYVKHYKDTINALMTSFGYNRSKQDMFALYKEVIARMCDATCSDIKWTDDGNIVYGYLICLYGDYGTSPRSGWFENKEAKEAVLEFLNEDLEYVKAEAEREKEEEKNNGKEDSTSGSNTVL